MFTLWFRLTTVSALFSWAVTTPVCGESMITWVWEMHTVYRCLAPWPSVLSIMAKILGGSTDGVN